MNDLATKYRKILLCFPELKKNGNFPRQFKRPHMEALDKRPHHDKRKSHAPWKNKTWSQEKKDSQKEAMGRSSRELEKRRKADRCHDEDEDFPRGPKIHSSKSGAFKPQKPHKSFHRLSHHHKPREDRLPKEGRQGKHKNKQSHAEEDGNDNLFLIKQRKKKKSKLRDSF